MVYCALSLLRELTPILQDRLVVFYYPSGERLLRTVKEFHRTRAVRLNHGFDIHEHTKLFDVLYTPYYWSDVSLPDVPVVSYIPDLQEHYFPQFFSEAVRQYRDMYYGYSARASTLLIVPSDYTKGTIIDTFHVPEDRVRVVYHGCHPIFSDQRTPGARPDALAPGIRDYWFYPAIPWRHKNHTALLDALAILKDRYEITIPCVFTGEADSRDPTLIDVAAESRNRGLTAQVFHLGNVSLKEMKYLYANARALVHPSLFEGFGMPLVEAMKCGCPLICSDRTSIPEIARDAALYFDPESPSAIADQFLHFLEAPALASQRVAIGREIAAQFSDRQSAEDSIAVCEEAYARAGIGASKTKCAERFPSDTRILSIAVVIGDRLPGAALISGIQHLMDEFENRLEAFVVADRAHEAKIRQTMPGSVTIVTNERGLRASLIQIGKQAQAEWLVFSDGHSLPLEYFVYYLCSQDVSESLLCGDSYYANSNLSRMYSLSAPIRDANQTRSMCSRDLAFAVRRQAFVEFMNWTSYDFKSPAELGFLLYDNCSRLEVHRAVNYVWNVPVSPARYYSDALKALLMNVLPGSGKTLCESPLGGILLRALAAMYAYTPQKWRYVVWSKGKSLAPGIFSFFRRVFQCGEAR